MNSRDLAEQFMQILESHFPGITPFFVMRAIEDIMNEGKLDMHRLVTVIEERYRRLQNEETTNQAQG
jgi:Ca2+-binding EF-hand superfamily protein